MEVTVVDDKGSLAASHQHRGGEVEANNAVLASSAPPVPQRGLSWQKQHVYRPAQMPQSLVSHAAAAFVAMAAITMPHTKNGSYYIIL